MERMRDGKGWKGWERMEGEERITNKNIPSHILSKILNDSKH